MSEITASPATELLELHELSKYGKIGGFHYLKPPGSRFSTVLSNRGCRGQCSFCSVRSFNGAGVRVRSVAAIVDELAELEEVYGVDHIVWLDDDFLFDRPHSLELFNAIVQRGLKITWDCSNGVIAAACSEDVIAGAAGAGCLGLVLGVESGNPHVLRQMRKPGTVDSFRKAAEVLSRYPSINTRIFLMFGFPGETRRMMRDTFALALEMNADWAIIQAVQPLPNTPLFDQMVAEGLVQPTDFKGIRYSLGYYGKLKDRKRDVMTNRFHDVFERSSLDDVPPASEYDDIWAYFNYNLNFQRLFHENRTEKLLQSLHWLEFVTDLVTPDGAIALYFRGLLESRLQQNSVSATLRRLHSILAGAPEWCEQFATLGFAPRDLQKDPEAHCFRNAYDSRRTSPGKSCSVSGCLTTSRPAGNRSCTAATTSSTPLASKFASRAGAFTNTPRGAIAASTSVKSNGTFFGLFSYTSAMRGIYRLDVQPFRFPP